MKKGFLILMCLIAFIGSSFKPSEYIASWETASKEEFLKASEKASNWFSQNTNYKVDITYSSFTDHSSTNAHDIYSGYYKRQNNNFASSAMGVLTIQNDKYRISVDTVNHLMMLQNKTEIGQAIGDAKSFSDLLDRVKAIKKQKGENGSVSYKIDFNQNDLYSAYEFKVNEKGYLVFMKYYYSKELKDEQEDKTLTGKPRLEVAFSNYQTNVKFNHEKDFSEKQFVKEEGKKIIPIGNYSKYEFKDYRYTVKK